MKFKIITKTAVAAAFLCCLLLSNTVRAAGDPSISEKWLTQRWTAEWSMYPDGPSNDPAAFLYRRTIDLPAKPDRFVVHVTADQRYRLFVNGVSVTNGPARGDLLHWRYESVDIAPFLKAGRNVVAARVWSYGIMSTWAQITTVTAFLLQGDGAAESDLNTPRGWKVYRDESWVPFPKIGVNPASCVAGSNERIYAAKHPWGWLDADFDDSKWPEPKRLMDAVPAGLRGDGSSYWYLVPRPIPLMEEKPARFPKIAKVKSVKVPDEFLTGTSPLTIPAKKKASFILDNVVLTNGYPEIVTSGGDGAVIRLSYEESLFKYPEVDMGHLIKGNRNDIKRCSIRSDYRFDEFMPDGGKSRLFSPYWWRSFRFVQVDIQTADEPLTIEDLRIVETGYPFVKRGSFKSDDPELTTIFDTGWRTARLCAGETYFDCPYYEQLQYAGDTRIQTNISYYVAGDDRLARNAIDLLNDSRIPDGLTMSRFPTRMHQVIPPFSLLWIGMIHDHWMFRGDKEFTKKYLDTMYSVLNWFTDRRLENGLLGNLPWWNFVDWAWPGGIPPGAEGEGSCIITLQYAMALREAADIEAQLGKPEIAKMHLALADKAVGDVTKACWVPKRGLLADSPSKTSYSQQANALGVLSDAIPQAAQRKAAETAFSDQSLTQCSLYFRFYLNKAADKVGISDNYLSLLDPWRKMLALGLTTWPETDGKSRSDCHAWSASPSVELLSIVCGIKPAAPGFSEVVIQPHLSGLKNVECEVPHPNGTIRASLRAEQGRVAAEIELPDGVTGKYISGGKETPLKPGKQSIK